MVLVLLRWDRKWKGSRAGAREGYGPPKPCRAPGECARSITVPVSPARFSHCLVRLIFSVVELVPVLLHLLHLTHLTSSFLPILSCFNCESRGRSSATKIIIFVHQPLSDPHPPFDRRSTIRHSTSASLPTVIVITPITSSFPISSSARSSPLPSLLFTTTVSTLVRHANSPFRP